MQRIMDFHIADLITKYLKGETTPSEIDEIQAWCKQNESNQLLFNQLTDVNYVGKQIKHWEIANSNQMWGKIKAQTLPEIPTRNLFTKRWAWAAALLLPLFIVGALLVYKANRNALNEVQMAQLRTKKANPSTYNQVQLILNDGSVVDLSKSANKKLSENDGTVIENDSSTLVYGKNENKNTALTYNTIVIPRKTQYQLVLADGTKAWLNAGSSLRFPTQFKGADRVVYLEGEAYFEVAKNAKMPFKVISGSTSVEVLGTHFNVMAYPNEKVIKTTLLEGSVNVSNGSSSKILVPGEQAQISGEQLKVIKANTDQIVAWKNGLFAFNDTDLPTVMRQVERWYDVDVSYDGKVPTTKLTGEIPRKVKLEELVNMLKYKGINLSLDSKTITIKAK
ncbi:DUF4974 domain-containing protein [Pedobacter sp. LMG 31464]|uniref:DUF4974 domain-containing protein n=1 Tax=Pedobacter planticolens TaxID=2679964 RepID=A0A923IW21_9SPHI|nr:FecR family protein [Pedobacter planticolens]MBB2144687.1 DUF4974 domain-containing protein [Pedobacter planticolens]